MYSDKFLKAVNWTIDRHEGGLANVAGDPGGLTKFGIAKASHPTVDIANLTRDDAIDIYFREYWDPNRYEEIEDGELAAKVFDEAVNCGAVSANKMLQRATVRVAGHAGLIDIDGKIGNFTLAAINLYHGDYLLCAFELEAVHYHVSLHNLKAFLPGWCARDLDEEGLT
jgi:lysozyme family protein